MFSSTAIYLLSIISHYNNIINEIVYLKYFPIDLFSYLQTLEANSALIEKMQEAELKKLRSSLEDRDKTIKVCARLFLL